VILAIDPGTERSAYVVYDGVRPVDHGIVENLDVFELMEILPKEEMQCCAVEMVASYGMPVGEEVFETVWWVGRFCHHWEFVTHMESDSHLVYRKQVKMHLCQSMRANDAAIRQSLIDKFGPGRNKAIGRKATPGPLYGVKRDIWSALAVAVTWWETMR
jgi:hypothetical protein